LNSSTHYFQIPIRGNATRESGLDTHNPNPIPLHSGAGLVDVGLLQAIQELGSASWTISQAADVEQNPHPVGGVARDLDQLIYVVGTSGTSIDHGCDAGRQDRRRWQLRIASVQMYVDQPRHDELSAGVDGSGGGGKRDVTAEGGNLSSSDSHIDDAVDALGRIDHPASADH
jgi:hypothetical protein